MGAYHKGSIHGLSTIYLNLITCKDKIFIVSIPQRYGLHWYHTYILHSGMDRTEAMIPPHLYWRAIREAVQKEVINYDTFQNTK